MSDQDQPPAGQPLVDKGAILQRAAGRWREIVLQLCPGLPAAALDGRNQPCPKAGCGGEDRWRVFSDFDSTGGAICNKCFKDRNSDGFSLLQWWNGWTFPQSLKRVAIFLGMVREHPADSSRPAEPSKKPASIWDQWRGREVSREERREIVAAWAAVKRGVDAVAALDSGALIGEWGRRPAESCIGFIGYRGNEPSALMLFRADGKPFVQRGSLSKRKTHNVKGSRNSWVHVGGRDRTAAADVVWRVEGLPDGLALLPLLPPNHGCITPTCGAQWSRLRDRQLPLDLLDGKVVISVGDADEPGQKGCWAFADACAVRRSIRAVLRCALPYDVSETSGPDLRDFINEQSPTLHRLLCCCCDWRKQRQLVQELMADDDDAQSVSFRNYHGDGKDAYAKTMGQLIREWELISGNWPRRVGAQLFSHRTGEVELLGSTNDLFAWMARIAHVQFASSNSGGLTTKPEFYAALTQQAENYAAIEHVPHHPLMPRHYYACGDYESGDGRHLRWLLNRLSPATDEDDDLIKLMLATAFWGGSPGGRPAFVITADGRGAGKTTLAAIAGALCNGFIDVSAREEIGRVKERLLTPEARDKRIVQIDNIKAHKFSSAEVEAMITAPIISGRQLYHGEAQRPNTVLWIFTMNGVSLSKDIAQRSVIIRIQKPRHSGRWTETTFNYIKEHRRELIGDLLGFLRESPMQPLGAFSRWGEWERAVLSRLENPAAAQRLIKERQEQCDVDSEETAVIEEHIHQRLHECRYNPDDDVVFIPSRVITDWCNELYPKMPSVRVSRMLNQHIEEGALPRLQYERNRAVRGFVWRGEFASSDADVRDDLEEKFSIYLKRGRDGTFETTQ